MDAHFPGEGAYVVLTRAQSPNLAPIAWVATLLIAAILGWWLTRGVRARRLFAGQQSARLRSSLDAAQRRISLFSESQERFVGNLAQEIKVPLANLLIRAELILAGSADPVTVHRYSKGIADGLRHLSDLVESFLRLARPYAQEDTSGHVPVHIHDLVIEAVRRCQSLALSRAVSVVPMLAEGRSDGSLQVLGDAALLEAMIENLVRNGVLSAPRGTRVDLHVKAAGDAVVVSVRDHGASIDEEQLSAVFQGFFQVPAPPRHTSKTGLSLAIAKRVAEHHRGTISLRNPPDGGCEFAVQLPRWVADDPPGSTRTPSSPPVKPSSRVG